ncbi:MAG: c-type cytochrome domain-containing protein, partial [Gemmataceae bacterium]
MPVRQLSVAAVILATAAASAAADKIPDDQLKFFESKSRPVLIAQCYSCHSAETKKGPKAGLALDTADGLRTGGDNGPAVVAGNAKKSLIIRALKGIDDQAQMPPKEKLPADVIADFEKWVAMGAPDPRTGAGKPDTKTADPNRGKDHWAFQPVKAVEPPKAGA